MTISFLEGPRKPLYECASYVGILVTKLYQSMGIRQGWNRILVTPFTGKPTFSINSGKCHSGRYGGFNAGKTKR
jgi:hypothetical protein